MRVRWTREAVDLGPPGRKVSPPGPGAEGKEGPWPAAVFRGHHGATSCDLIVQSALLDKWSQRDKRTYRIAVGFRRERASSRRAPPAGRKCAVSVVVVVQCDSQLLQIVAAFGAPGGLTCGLDGCTKRADSRRPFA